MMTISVDRHVWVPMPDGVRLAADVFRPPGGGRHPVVLLRTPYDRRQAASFGLQIDALRLVEAGYAVVTQDVRGRFASEGAFVPFEAEAADGVATIEWAAEQPWSTGIVAMAGMSYCGYAQVLAAREQPEPLRAWIPAFCPVDVRTEWIYDGDAFQLAFNLAWTLASVAAPDRRTVDPTLAMTALDDWAATVRREVGDRPELAGSPAADIYRAWLERRGDDEWWSALSGRGAGRHDAAALVVGGWFDVFHRGTMALHEELTAGRAVSATLLLGPWDHSPLPVASRSGEVEFGWRAALDLPGLFARWLDHVLRDGPAPVDRPARTFVTGANAWMDWDAWPPPAHTEVRYTAPGGRLLREAPPAASDRFQFDAADPTPSVGGRVYPRPGQMRSGQLDQSERGRRADVVSFADEAADRELLIAGPVRAEIWSAAAGAADIAATLLDIGPDGRALNIAEGVARRLDLEQETACFDVDLGHVAHVLLPDHRIGLAVSAAAFPRVDRVPKRGTWERSVAHGAATASRIFLPVVGGPA